MFGIYHYSTSALLKGSVQSGLLQDVQVASRKLRRAVRLAPQASLSVAADGSGISLLSAEDADGKFHFDPALTLARWQKYQVFYFAASARELAMREVSVLGTPQEWAPGPIESFGPGTPVESYFSGGKPFLSRVDSAVFSQPTPTTLGLELKVSQTRSLSRTPEQLTLRIVSGFRN